MAVSPTATFRRLHVDTALAVQGDLAVGETVTLLHPPLL